MTAQDLVILDRDGVINQDSPHHVRSPEMFVPLPGSIEAIARLSGAGVRVAIATNQSGLARGLFDRAAQDAIHARLLDAVRSRGGEIMRIEVCPHGPEDGCDCRKPAPGLLLRVAESFGVGLASVPFVGDSLRDLQAARAAGCAPVLVRTGNGARVESSGEAGECAVFDDLAAFADGWLRARSAPRVSAIATGSRS